MRKSPGENHTWADDDRVQFSTGLAARCRSAALQVIPPADRAKAVSLTTSGMYLGSAAAMLFLPWVAHSAGPAAIFRLVGLLALLWLLMWRLTASGPTARYRINF